MSNGFEGFASSKEKKEKELTDKEKKEALEKSFEFQKNQEVIRSEIRTKEALDNLKDLIDSGVISESEAKKLSEGSDVSFESIEAIFSKIDELIENDKEHKILPLNLKISKAEYIESLSDPNKKQLMLNKINASLDYVYQSIGGGGLVFGFFSVLGLNLVKEEIKKVQGNLIEIKNSIINNV